MSSKGITKFKNELYFLNCQTSVKLNHHIQNANDKDAQVLNSDKINIYLVSSANEIFLFDP